LAQLSGWPNARGGRESVEPGPGNREQAFGLEPVDALAAAQDDRDEPGSFEHAQVLGGCQPPRLEIAT
jgi:hypothetical protein